MLLNELEGWVTRTHATRDDGGGAPNGYRVHWQRVKPPTRRQSVAHPRRQSVAHPRRQLIAQGGRQSVAYPPEQLASITPLNPSKDGASEEAQPPVESAFPDRVQQVFRAWQEATQRDAKMSEAHKKTQQRKRCNRHVRKVIEENLAEFPFEDILAAAQGWVHDDWEERHTDYVDLQFVLKPGNVDKFAAWHRDPETRPKVKPGGYMPAVPHADWDNLTADDMKLKR